MLQSESLGISSCWLASAKNLGTQDAKRNGSPAALCLRIRMKTWTQAGLRYVVIGGANAEAIEHLAELLRGTK